MPWGGGRGVPVLPLRANPAPLPGRILSWAANASYLTNSMPTLERFPISFKTHFSGNYFRHIVLGVNFGGRYGALGMSRREDLMYKPPAFRTLSELVLDYEAAYGRCWHVLKKVKLGQCVSHDPHSVEQIEWKHSVLDVDKLGREDFRKELERHARDMRLKVSVRAGPARAQKVLCRGAGWDAPPLPGGNAITPRPTPTATPREIVGGKLQQRLRSDVTVLKLPPDGRAREGSRRRRQVSWVWGVGRPGTLGRAGVPHSRWRVKVCE